MSMTKDQFFEEIFAMVEPTEAQLEEQYYYEMARRRQLYIDHITEQIMAKPESHWFSQDYEAQMQTNGMQLLNGLSLQRFLEARKDSKAGTYMDFNLSSRSESQNSLKRDDNSDDLFF